MSGRRGWPLTGIGGAGGKHAGHRPQQIGGQGGGDMNKLPSPLFRMKCEARPQLRSGREAELRTVYHLSQSLTHVYVSLHAE